MEMTSKERTLLALNHREADRVAIHDSPWATTVTRWRTEGMPEDVGPAEYFGYEFRGFAADVSLRLEARTLEETDEYVIALDSQGAVRKNWKNRTSTPECIDFTIRDRRTWEALKPRTEWSDDRVDWDRALDENRRAAADGWFCCFSGALGYDKTQGMVGSERLLTAMCDDPGWVRDMFDASARMLVRACDEMLGRGFEFHGAFLYDDLGYRNATLFSPRMYRELLFPAHKLVNDYMASRGLPTILHSCGNVLGIVPMLIEAGWRCLQPLEQKAGMDLIELKKKYGDRLAFMGGIDVRELARGPEAVEREISAKLGFAKRGGGYIYHSDHSVPDNVSLDNYRKALDCVREYGRYGP